MIPKESICPRCARDMEAQTMGEDEEGKPIVVYVCHSCNPRQSGALDNYYQCLGYLCAPRRKRGW
jgi:hypothetical protein